MLEGVQVISIIITHSFSFPQYCYRDSVYLIRLYRNTYSQNVINVIKILWLYVKIRLMAYGIDLIFQNRDKNSKGKFLHLFKEISTKMEKAINLTAKALYHVMTSIFLYSLLLCSCHKN